VAQEGLCSTELVTYLLTYTSFCSFQRRTVYRFNCMVTGQSSGGLLDNWGSIPGVGCKLFSSIPYPNMLWGPPSFLTNE